MAQDVYPANTGDTTFRNGSITVCVCGWSSDTKSNGAGYTESPSYPEISGKYDGDFSWPTGDPN